MLLQRKKALLVFALVMYPILLLLIIRFASFEGSSLSELIDYINEEVSIHPFRFQWSSHTVPAGLIFTAVYAGIWFVIITSLKNIRPGEEHGSAKWVSAGALGRKLRARGAYSNNILYSNKVRVAMDTKCENINTLILGGAGRMKSRGFIMPNIMQMNSKRYHFQPLDKVTTKQERQERQGHIAKINQNGQQTPERRPSE